MCVGFPCSYKAVDPFDIVHNCDNATGKNQDESDYAQNTDGIKPDECVCLLGQHRSQ